MKPGGVEVTASVTTPPVQRGGAALFLSVKTVEFHLGRVFRTLEVRSRTALRVLMEQLGLL